MSLVASDPGSFRDPGGRIYSDGKRILRAVMPSSAPAYTAARDAGLLERLAGKGMLLDSQEVDAAPLSGVQPAPAVVLEHPRVPYVSYPYEWSFALHRKAALLQLDLHLEALESGFPLSDATAYNIQFIGTKPIFIDHLSLRPYRDGEYWIGHRQFCMQFLNPLLMWTALGVQPNAWFRGSLEGIAPEDMAPLLSWRQKLSPTVLSHVVAPAAAARRMVQKGGGDEAPQGKLALSGFKAMLKSLRFTIADMKLKDQKTVWSSYAGDNSYEASEAAAKRAFVGEAVASAKPDILYDIGCNTGDYSQAALEAGAKYVVAFDFDHGALEQAFSRFEASSSPVLPLWLDAANPSPSQGWAQAERRGMGERGGADFLIALAFIHHIVIGRNVPVGMALDWLLALAPGGVIEFPPKEDPMVKRLLAHREDVFPDYGIDTFMRELQTRARVVRTLELSENGRLLVLYDRQAR